MRRRVRLGDLFSIKHGFAFPGDEFSEDPAYPTVTTPGNFAIGGGFKQGRPKTFSGKIDPEYTLKPGALILSLTDLSKNSDTLGSPALVPPGRTYLHNQRIGLVVPKVAECVPRFLAYYLRMPDYRHHVVGTASGSTVKHTSPSRIYEFEADIPDVAAQLAIAAVLSALDDKIAANTKLATTADELARSMVDRALSYGSHVASIAEIAEFHNRKRIPLSSRDREARIGTVPYYGANGMIDTVDEAIFDGVYVLVGEDGSVITSFGTPVVTYIWGPAWVNNHAHVLTGSTVSTDLLYYLVRGTRIESIVTGAVQPKVSMGNLKSVMLDVPLNEALPRLEHEVELLRARCRSAVEESGRLERTRSALLPALMSGRLTVRDAEAAVESAVEGDAVEPEAQASGTLW